MRHLKPLRVALIGVTTVLSSIRFLDDGTRGTRKRIAPGTGDGDIVQRYRVEDGATVLSRFAIELQGQPAITLWPQH